VALQPVVSVGGGAVMLYADVVNGTVVGARVEVPAGSEADVDYVNGATVIMRGVFAGVQTVTLAKSKQFTYATATATRAGMTIRWPA
jgi:hypothetical protein